MKQETSNFLNIKNEMQKRILIAAHKGIVGGNIPPNTLEAFETALRSGADIIECDVMKSIDGELFMFHPGTELECTSFDKGALSRMTADEIRKVKLYNICRAETQYPVYTLDEALDYLKGKCYINLDKCWTCLPEIMKVVRDHKIEEQILLKSDPKMKYIDEVEEIASDVNYMPVFSAVDNESEIIEKRKINYFGAELVYSDSSSVLASDEYIEKMHQKGRLLWVNAIVFSYKTVLTGGHTDDVSLTANPDDGWGWMADRGYDIIQTDWPLLLKNYLLESGKTNKRI